MSYKFISETPEMYESHTATNKIEFTVQDDASLTEMLESFEYFLKANGYQLQHGHIQFVEDEVNFQQAHESHETYMKRRMSEDTN
jgi:predicted house-cleaning NTP pyrophosphatase (Maf/HAM1 superfamily)